jgi:hypothetical protein
MSLTFDLETHTYRWNGRIVPGVTDILRETGLARYFGSDPYYLERGRYVAQAIDLLEKGRLDRDSLTPEIALRVGAWEKAKEKYGFTVLETETPKYHMTLRYSGTPDAIVLMDGERWVIDNKVSDTINPAVRAQLAGYALLHDGVASSSLVTTKRAALLLMSDGNPRLLPCTDPSDFGAWINAVSLYSWSQRAGVKGEI